MAENQEKEKRKGTEPQCNKTADMQCKSRVWSYQIATFKKL